MTPRFNLLGCLGMILKCSWLGTLGTIPTEGDQKQQRCCCEILTHFIFATKAFCMVGGEGERMDGQKTHDSGSLIGRLNWDSLSKAAVLP